MTNCSKCGREIYWNEKYKSKCRHWVPLEKNMSGQYRRHLCPEGNKHFRRAYDRRREFYSRWL